MTRSELADLIAKQYPSLGSKYIEEVVKMILEYMSNTLAEGKRIEIRGFGSFSLHYRAPRRAHNPKTGQVFQLGCQHVPHFKPGKELKQRVNDAANL